MVNLVNEQRDDASSRRTAVFSSEETGVDDHFAAINAGSFSV
jgi:hypothetical protein